MCVGGGVDRERESCLHTCGPFSVQISKLPFLENGDLDLEAPVPLADVRAKKRFRQCRLDSGDKTHLSADVSLSSDLA